MSTPLLSVRGLCKHYLGGPWWRRERISAVQEVGFDLYPGQTLALVGESGSGKSTVGKLVTRLERSDAGSVQFAGQDLGRLHGPALRAIRRELQIVFQDPFSAIDPRMPVGRFVEEPLRVHGLYPDARERAEVVAATFEKVGFDPALMGRHARAFSGGQRQRICIARAIIMQPRLIVADEPITALDVSIQAQIVNLLQRLQEESGVAYLFISHDLSMVRHLSHQVAVMRQGRIVEQAPTARLFQAPLHPYTQALLSAVPVPDPRIERGRQRQRFDAAAHPIAADARLREVAPEHYLLG
ncbi:MAG: Oligopeptide transport ATP-binding protein OppF [Stenotrophomonas maltophilia]|nr:MAG: Oligopeptide transport ATP-binding protein OppF [Stenotrophomonas maltophilia]